jgi:pimeloyl-ACP methyl ester carboxylesterase
MSTARETIEFEGKDGIRIVGDAFGSPDDPPVLLSHGGGQTRHSWAGTAEVLAGAGWYAVSIDLRGHGESGWSEDGDYHFESFAADVGEVAASMARPPVLVGASLGGISSLLVSARSDPPPAGLVLVDIATRMESEGAQRIMEFMQPRPGGFASLEEAADAISAYNPHRKRPKDLSGLRKNLREREDGRFDWHWDPRFMSREGREEEGPPDFESLDELARSLALPTLLVRGRMSDLLSQEGADHFLELVPHAKFADVSGAGHMVAGDRNDAFSGAVVEFLREQVRR